MGFKIVTDSSADIKKELLDSWGVELLSLSFRFTDDEVQHTDADMPVADFYTSSRDAAPSWLQSRYACC